MDYAFALTNIFRDTVYISKIDINHSLYNRNTLRKIRYYGNKETVLITEGQHEYLLLNRNNYSFTVNAVDFMSSIPAFQHLNINKVVNKNMPYESDNVISTSGEKLSLSFDTTLLYYDFNTGQADIISLKEKIYNNFAVEHIRPQLFSDYYLYLVPDSGILRFINLENHKISSIRLRDYDKEYINSKTHHIYGDSLLAVTSNNNVFILINNKLEVIDTFTWTGNRKINNITKDRQGNYWISTFDDGLYFISKNLMPFKKLTIDGVSSRIVSMYFFDGKYYFYDDASSLHITDENFNILKKITFPILYKSYPEIKTFWMFRDKDNGYYIASAFGTYYMNENYQVRNIDGSHLRVSFKDFYYDSTTENILAANMLGLAEIDKHNNFKFHFKNDIHTSPVRTMQVNKMNNQFWNSSDIGKIIIMDTSFKNKKIIDIKTKIDFSTTEAGRFVFSVEGYALYCYEYGKNKVSVIQKNENYQFFRKTDSGIWAANENYIVLFKWDGNKYLTNKKYLNLNGLLYNEVYDIAECNGEQYIVSDKGIIQLPDTTFTYSDKGFTQSATIQSFSIGDTKKYFFSKEDSIFSYVYTPDDISIQFGCNSTAFLGNTSYSYFIDGSSVSWQTTTDELINYPALAPGKYKILLKASVNDLDLTTETKTFTLVVLPRWWQSLIFKIFLALVVITVIILLFYIRVRTVRAKEQKQSSLDKKMAELELTALQSQMNPHFIFNSLTSVQSFINTDRSEDADWLLRQFSLLIRLYLEFSRNKFITIEQELMALRIYTDIEKMRFGNKFDVEFKVRNQRDTSLDHIYIPPMLLQPLVENAINHGLYHKSGEDGKLKVVVLIKDAQTTVVIDDNGIGREAAKKLRNKIFPSVGNQLIKDRIKTLNDSGRANASIEITDKFDTNNHPAGTRVTLTITNYNYDKSLNN